MILLDYFQSNRDIFKKQQKKTKRKFRNTCFFFLLFIHILHCYSLLSNKEGHLQCGTTTIYSMKHEK